MQSGPSDETRRDVLRPRTWLGLSPDDLLLAREFLAAVVVHPAELHTAVPVGERRDLDLGGFDEVSRRVAAAVLPRRVDLAMRYGRRWWLVELKPYARHHAIGQLLTYAYWWYRDLPDLGLGRLVLVTDRADEGIAEVAVAAGITVVELEERLGGLLPHTLRDRS